MKLCQSCGMPLSDNVLGTNADGGKNHEYCVYCYKDGHFVDDYTMQEMAEYCSMFVEEYNKDSGQYLTCCEYKEKLLQLFPSLKRWNLSADDSPKAGHPMKKLFVEEVNALGIPELHIDNLYIMPGLYINQPYNLNGNVVKLLDDNVTYWTNQVQKKDGRCYGIACCERCILVSEYGKDGSDAELVLLKRR